jgi:hypothetical protein
MSNPPKRANLEVIIWKNLSNRMIGLAEQLETGIMNESTNREILDTVLTLRGHQITLRQAIAEGIVKGRFDPETGIAEVQGVDARWFIDGPPERKRA